jgi:hypothetical protein
MKQSGCSPQEVFLAARREGRDWPSSIRIIRAVFGLSFVEAKEIWVVAERKAGSLSEWQERLLPPEADDSPDLTCLQSNSTRSTGFPPIWLGLAAIVAGGLLAGLLVPLVLDRWVRAWAWIGLFMTCQIVSWFLVPLLPIRFRACEE